MADSSKNEKNYVQEDKSGNHHTSWFVDTSNNVSCLTVVPYVQEFGAGWLRPNMLPWWLIELRLP